MQEVEQPELGIVALFAHPEGKVLPPTAFVPIEEILAHPHNWRVHPPEQMEALRQSFGEFGSEMDPADFNTRTQHLLDGHARMELLKERGETHLYCQLLDMSEEEERRWLLTKGKTEEMAKIDDVNLKILLEEYKEDGDYPAGWSQDDFDAIVKRETALLNQTLAMGQAPEPEEVAEPTCQPGQVWRVGPHLFGCLDSEEPGNVETMLSLAGIPGVSQVFTDPPYQMETSGGAYTTDNGQDLYNRSKLDAIETSGLSRCDPEAEFLPTLAAWFGWRGEVPQKDEHLNVFVYCNDALQLPYLRWTAQSGGTWATLLWDKNRGDPLGGRHETSVEYLLWLKYRACWNERSDVPDADRSKLLLRYEVTEAQKASNHPTPKSVDLARNEMMLTTKFGEWVADPYGGTGAHAVAAAMCGRNSLYMDTDPHWVDFAVKWMELVTGETAQLVTPFLSLEQTA